MEIVTMENLKLVRDQVKGSKSGMVLDVNILVCEGMINLLRRAC